MSRLAAAASSRIRVVIVDDQPLFRKGLESVLLHLDDMVVVGQASDGEQAISECVRTMPDVVLVDLVMPGMDGAAATKIIRRCCPHTQVLGLANLTDEEIIGRALRAGAVGCVSKSMSCGDVVRAIRAARAGQPSLAPEALRALMRVVSDPRLPGSDLTRRELQVLSLLADGMSNAEIAARLYVSPSTAKTHVSRLMAKLGVSTRTEAATLAVREHLV